MKQMNTLVFKENTMEVEVIRNTAEEEREAAKTEFNVGERVRFSKHTKKPRRLTMFTVRDGKYVYFGISKWNVKYDKYNRKEGIDHAKSRAYAAKNSVHSELDSFIAPGGYSGKYRVRDFSDMVAHFERMK